MLDLITLLAAPVTWIVVTSIVCWSLSAAWRGWLKLRQNELAVRRAQQTESVDRTPALRIELADFKERLRKLEAIARGVDL